MSHTPVTIAEALRRTEEIHARSSNTFEGTRPDGPGVTAINGLAYAIEALRNAQECVQAAGEGGI